jgi:outer membrane protein TolC
VTSAFSKLEKASLPSGKLEIVLKFQVDERLKKRIHFGMRKRCSRVVATVLAVGWIALQGSGLAASPPKNPPKAVPVVPSSSKTETKTLYLDIRGYIKRVLARDPGLVASRLAQMSNEKEAESIRAKYLPYLKGDAEAGLLEGANRFNLFAPSTIHDTIRNPQTGAIEVINEPNQFRTLGFHGYSIFGPTLEMPLFKDGTFLGINTPPAVNAKRAQGEALAATARLDAQEVTFRATDLFLQAIVTSNQAKILRNRLDWIQKQTDLVHEQAKYDLVSQADVQVADTKLAEYKVDVLIAGQRAVDAFYRACELLGVDDPRVLRIDTKYPQANPLPSFEGTVLRDIPNHPRIEIQQAQAKKADAELALERSKLYPTGRIVSAYRFGNNLQDVGEARWISFVSLTAPIFDFGERWDAVKAADLKLKEENALIAKAHDQVRQEVFDVFTHLREVLETQTAVTSLVAERQRTVDRLEELNKYQRAPVPELIKGQLDLLEAKRSEEGIRYAVLLASAELEKATAGAYKWIR